MMRRCAWILCLVAMTSSASAQLVRREADLLFRQGKELMAQQKYAEACTAFELSYELEPNISTQLNRADCREKNAQLATAWQLFVEAAKETRARTDATSRQLNGVASERARKLEPRLSKLSINVSADCQIPGLEILRGVDHIDPETWNHPVPIDGGTYIITVRAPEHEIWATTVIVKPERDVQTVEVRPLSPEAPAEPKPDPFTPRPSAPAPAPARSAEMTPAASARPASGSLSPGAPRPREGAGVAALSAEQPRPGAETGRAATASAPPAVAQQPRPRPAVARQASGATKRSLALPIAMGSAALILGGSALAFSRWGDSVYGDAEREPDNTKQEALWQSANRRRHAAIGFAAGAAGCLGAAVYLYLRGGREAAQPVAHRSLRIEPAATASSLGLGLRGAW